MLRTGRVVSQSRSISSNTVQPHGLSRVTNPSYAAFALGHVLHHAGETVVNHSL